MRTYIYIYIYIYIYPALLSTLSLCVWKHVHSSLYFIVTLDMPLCAFLLMPSFFMFQTERMSRRQYDRERNHQEWGCGKQEWRLLVMTHLSIYSNWAYHKNLSMYAFWGYIAYIDISMPFAIPYRLPLKLQISGRSRY